jgi:hypothetical protein
MISIRSGVFAAALFVAQSLNAYAAAPMPSIRLQPIAEPAYAIVSSSADLGQYDSRTFVPQGAAQISFAQSMARENLHLGTELRTRIEEALTRAGLRVSTVADRELSVIFSPDGARYSDEVLGDDFTPSYSIILRLTAGKASPVEFRITYAEGANGPHTISPDARFRFTSQDALLTEPSAAAEGLRAGLLPMANEIAAIVRAQRLP